MIKRILVALAVLLVSLFGGGVLVGFGAISANAGVAVWVIGIVLAIAAFVGLKPKS